MADTEQTVPHDVWTQSEARPELWMFQNSGGDLVVVVTGGGGVLIEYPERWRFVRAFRTSDSHGWVAAPDLVPPFPPPLPDPGAST